MLSPTDDTKKVIKTTHQYSRGYAFEEFYFSIKDTDALPYKVDEMTYQFEENIKEVSNDVDLPKIDPKDAFNDLDVPF